MSAFGGKADMVFCGANVRFDPKRIDNATVDVLTGLGGVAAIAISHPHYYTTMGVEPRARGSADPSECG